MSLTVKKAKELLEASGYTVISPSSKKAKDKAKGMYESYKKNHGNMAAVAREYGITRERVRQVLSKHYALRGTGVRDNTERVKEVREAFIKNKFDVPKTAEELGLTAWHVASMRKTYFPELAVAKRKETPEISDDVIRELYAEFNGNIRQIARCLKKRPAGIYDRCAVLGLKGKGCHKVTNNEIIKAMEKSEGNKSAAARLLGITPAAVVNRVFQLKSKGLVPQDFENHLRAPK